MILEFLSRIFGGRRKDQVSRGIGGQRYLSLDDGDSCLILKKDGRSVIVDSGDRKLSPADEIICMVLCYLANPEFVKILYSMFSEIVDEVNRDKMSDDRTVGRSGVYAKVNGEGSSEGGGSHGADSKN